MAVGSGLQRTRSTTPSQHPAALLLVAIVIAVALALAVGAASGIAFASRPGLFALAVILLLGGIHLLARAADQRPTLSLIGPLLTAAAAVALGHAAAQHWLAGSLPDGGLPRAALDRWLMACIVAAFAALVVLQNLPPRWRASSAWEALHAHAANGFYANTLANRWVLRFWPTPHPSLRNQPGARA